MGDSLSPAIGDICHERSVARVRGLENLLCFDPGAYAPGFKLPPASQAKTYFVQSRREMDLAPAPQYLKGDRSLLQ